MDKNSIDKFFASLSKDALKEKWHKYDKYSEFENNVTVSELIEVWNAYYENTFIYHKLDLSDNGNIIKEESENIFGLFFFNLKTQKKYYIYGAGCI